MKLKKLSAACLAALISTVGLHSFMPESGFNSTAYAAETITGDANGDGKVTALDAAFIARKLAEQKGSELPSNADYNGDKKTTAGDAAAIAFRLANNYNITKMIELTNNERTKKGIALLSLMRVLQPLQWSEQENQRLLFHIPVLTTHHSTQYLMISI